MQMHKARQWRLCSHSERMSSMAPSFLTAAAAQARCRQQLLSQLCWPLDRRALPRDTVLVGGAVRDALLGRLATHPDLDLVVPAHGIALCQALSRTHGGTAVVLDRERDIGRWVKGPWSVDVACRAGTDLRADLARRDFSLNAMALLLDSAELVDPHGGLEALRQRRIRCFNPANLDADPLRCLRAFRIAAELGFRLETATAAAIANRTGNLASVAAERVLVELERLLQAPGAAELLPQLLTTGLLRPWFPRPELPGRDSIPAVLGGLPSEVLRQAWADAALVLLSAGMPTPLAKLRASRQRRQWVSELGEWRRWLQTNQLQPGQGKQQGGNAPAERVRLHRRLGDGLPTLLLLAHWDRTLDAEAISTWMARWQDTADPLFHPRTPLDGDELRLMLGCRPGPALGRLLEHLMVEQAWGRICDRQTAIRSAEQWWRNNGTQNDGCRD